MKWIKIVSDFCDDEKIKIIRQHEGGDTFVWIWLWLLTTAMKKETDTLYIVGHTPYDPQMIALQADVKPDAAHKALDIFARLQMIELADDGGIFIINWAKHQSMNAMLEKREQNRIRQERNRAAKREALQLPDAVTRDQRDGHAPEKRREEERREENKKTLPAKSPAASFPATMYETVEAAFAEAFKEKTGDDYPTGKKIGAGRACLRDLFTAGADPEKVAEMARRYVKEEADGRYFRYTVAAFAIHYPDMIAGKKAATPADRRQLAAYDTID